METMSDNNRGFLTSAQVPITLLYIWPEEFDVFLLNLVEMQRINRSSVSIKCWEQENDHEKSNAHGVVDSIFEIMNEIVCSIDKLFSKEWLDQEINRRPERELIIDRLDQTDSDQEKDIMRT